MFGNDFFFFCPDNRLQIYSEPMTRRSEYLRTAPPRCYTETVQPTSPFTLQVCRPDRTYLPGCFNTRPFEGHSGLLNTHGSIGELWPRVTSRVFVSLLRLRATGCLSASPFSAAIGANAPPPPTTAFQYPFPKQSHIYYCVITLVHNVQGSRVSDVSRPGDKTL